MLWWRLQEGGIPILKLSNNEGEGFTLSDNIQQINLGSHERLRIQMDSQLLSDSFFENSLLSVFNQNTTLMQIECQISAETKTTLPQSLTEIAARNRALKAYQVDASPSSDADPWDLLMEAHWRYQYLDDAGYDRGLCYVFYSAGRKRNIQEDEIFQDEQAFDEMGRLGGYYFFKKIAQAKKPTPIVNYESHPNFKLTPIQQMKAILRVYQELPLSFPVKKLCIGYDKESNFILDFSKPEVYDLFIKFLIANKKITSLCISYCSIHLDESTRKRLCQDIQKHQITTRIFFRCSQTEDTEENFYAYIDNITARNARLENRKRVLDILSGQMVESPPQPVTVRPTPGRKRNKQRGQHRQRLQLQHGQQQKQQQQAEQQQAQQQQQTQQQILQQRQHMADQVSEQQAQQIQTENRNFSSKLIGRDSLEDYYNSNIKNTILAALYTLDSLFELWDRLTGNFKPELKPPNEEMITQVTEDAFRFILQHKELFKEGINFHNPPPGFFIRKIQDSKLILCYDPYNCPRDQEPNPLTIQFNDVVETPSAECSDARALYEYGIGAWVDTALCSEYTGIYKKLFDAEEKLIEENDLLPLIQNFYKLIEIDLKQLYPQEKDQEKFLKKIQAFESLFLKLNYDSFKKIVLLFQYHGTEAVVLFLNQLDKLDNIKITATETALMYFSETILKRTNDFSTLISPDALKAFDAVLQWQTEPSTRLWWQKLLAAHVKQGHSVDFVTLVNAFSYFQEQLQRLSEKRGCGPCQLPNTFEIVDAGHMQITLDRLLFLLERSIDPHEQLQNLRGIDLSAHGAYFSAYFQGYYSVHEFMELMNDSWLDKPSEETSVVYHTEPALIERAVQLIKELENFSECPRWKEEIKIGIFRYLGSTTRIRSFADYEKIMQFFFDHPFQLNENDQNYQAQMKAGSTILCCYILTGFRAFTENIERVYTELLSELEKIENPNSIGNLIFILQSICKQNIGPNIDETIALLKLAQTYSINAMDAFLSDAKSALIEPLREDGFVFFDRLMQNKAPIACENLLKPNSTSQTPVSVYLKASYKLYFKQTVTQEWPETLAKIFLMFASFHNTSTISNEEIEFFVSRLSKLSPLYLSEFIELFNSIDLKETPLEAAAQLTLQRISQLAETLEGQITADELHSTSEFLRRNLPRVQFKNLKPSVQISHFAEHCRQLSLMMTPAYFRGMQYHVLDHEPTAEELEQVQCGAQTLFVKINSTIFLYCYNQSETGYKKIKIEDNLDEKSPVETLATIAKKHGALITDPEPIKGLSLAGDYIQSSPDFNKNCLTLQRALFSSDPTEQSKSIQHILTIINKLSGLVKSLSLKKIKKEIKSIVVTPLEKQVQAIKLPSDLELSFTQFLKKQIDQAEAEQRGGDINQRTENIFMALIKQGEQCRELVILLGRLFDKAAQSTQEVISLIIRHGDLVSIEKLTPLLELFENCPLAFHPLIQNLYEEIEKIDAAQRDQYLSGIIDLIGKLNQKNLNSLVYEKLFTYAKVRLKNQDNANDFITNRITELQKSFPGVYQFYQSILTLDTSLQDTSALFDTLSDYLTLNFDQPKSIDQIDQSLLSALFRWVKKPDAISTILNNVLKNFTDKTQQRRVLGILIGSYLEMLPAEESVDAERIEGIIQKLKETPIPLDAIADLYTRHPAPTDETLLSNLSSLEKFNTFKEKFEMEPAGERHYPIEFSTDEVERILTNIIDKESDLALDEDFKQSLLEAFYYVNLLGYELPLPNFKKPICKLTSAEIQQAILERKKGTLNQARYELIALFREAMYRTRSQPNHIIMPNSTQIICVLLATFIDKNVMLEINTGEGKSIIVALLAALHWAEGLSSDVSSSDLKLAGDDLEKVYPFFQYIGAKSASIAGGSDEHTYETDGGNYSTLGNFSLYESRAIITGENIRQQKRAAIIDEGDQAIFDEKTAYNFSPALDDNDPLKNIFEWIYPYILQFIKTEAFLEQKYSAEDDVANLRLYLAATPSVTTTQQTQLQGLDDERLSDWIDAAIAADELVDAQSSDALAGGDYICLEHEREQDRQRFQYACILLEGRPSLPSRWADGAHQFLHAKLNQLRAAAIKSAEQKPFIIEPETVYTDSRVNVNQLARYAKILGFSGTFGSRYEAAEIAKTQNARVFKIPTHNKLIRQDSPPDYVNDFKSQIKKISAVIESSAKKHNKQPILLLVKSIKDVERWKEELQLIATQQGYTIQTADGTNEVSENDIRNGAGKQGIITIATQIFARGTDIPLANEFKKEHGLRVHYTRLLFSRQRGQAIGRAGRNGNAGSSGATIAWNDVIETYGAIAERHGMNLTDCKTPEKRRAAVEKIEKAVYEEENELRTYEQINASVRGEFLDRFDDWYGELKSHFEIDSEFASLLKKFLRIKAKFIKKLERHWNDVLADNQWKERVPIPFDPKKSGLSSAGCEYLHRKLYLNRSVNGYQTMVFDEWRKAELEFRSLFEKEKMQALSDAVSEQIKRSESPYHANPHDKQRTPKTNIPLLADPYRFVLSTSNQTNDDEFENKIQRKSIIEIVRKTFEYIKQCIKDLPYLQKESRNNLLELFTNAILQLMNTENGVEKQIQILVEKTLSLNLKLTKNNDISIFALNDATVGSLIRLFARNQRIVLLKPILETLDTRLKRTEKNRPTMLEQISIAKLKNQILRSAPLVDYQIPDLEIAKQNTIQKLKERLTQYTETKFSFFNHIVSKDRKAVAKNLNAFFSTNLNWTPVSIYEELAKATNQTIKDDITCQRPYKKSTLREYIEEAKNQILVDLPADQVEAILRIEMESMQKIMQFVLGEENEIVKQHIFQVSENDTIQTMKEKIKQGLHALRNLSTAPITDQMRRIIGVYEYTEDHLKSDPADSVLTCYQLNRNLRNAELPALTPEQKQALAHLKTQVEITVDEKTEKQDADVKLAFFDKEQFEKAYKITPEKSENIKENLMRIMHYMEQQLPRQYPNVALQHWEAENKTSTGQKGFTFALTIYFQIATDLDEIKNSSLKLNVTLTDTATHVDVDMPEVLADAQVSPLINESQVPIREIGEVSSYSTPFNSRPNSQRSSPAKKTVSFHPSENAVVVVKKDQGAGVGSNQTPPPSPRLTSSS